MGGIIPDISQGGTLDLGEDDDNQTQSRSVGVSGQVVDTDKIFGRDNNLTVGHRSTTAGRITTATARSARSL